MRTSALATIHAIVPASSYVPGDKGSQADFVNVGMAQSIRIEDNFGTKAENIIGSPLPIIHPGFMMTTISIEKATVDGYGFRDLGGFNPLQAHLGKTYRNESLIGINQALGDSAAQISPDNDKMYPFMFILAIRDKVSGRYDQSSFPQLKSGTDGSDTASIDRTTNLIGSYVCVLTQASISLQASNHVIVDSISAYARPLTGTWFNKAMRDGFRNQRNGMDDFVNSVLFGYRSREDPRKLAAAANAEKKDAVKDRKAGVGT